MVKRPIGALACHKGEEEYSGSAERRDFKTRVFQPQSQVKRAELSLLCILVTRSRIVAKNA